MTQPTLVQPPTPTQPIDFYSDIGDPKRDSFRIPLIKPYELTGTSYPGSWGIKLYYHDTKPYTDPMHSFLGINSVAKFTVENGVIVAMTDKKLGNERLQWFVIIPDKQVEVGFNNEAEFKKYIQTYNITEPSWFTTKEAYKQLKDTGCLPWIPGCK